jgi:hypothetical protein
MNTPWKSVALMAAGSGLIILGVIQLRFWTFEPAHDKCLGCTGSPYIIAMNGAYSAFFLLLALVSMVSALVRYRAFVGAATGSASFVGLASFLASPPPPGGMLLLPPGSWGNFLVA